MTITAIYVSPDYSDEWEENLLEDTILYPGDDFEISFTGYGDQCYFDVRIEDEDGDTYTKFAVDLCSLWEIEFSMDDLD